MRSKKIVLIGAYGYTGKLICELLQIQAIPFVAAGRDSEKLKTLQSEFTSITDILSIDVSNLKDSDFINKYDVFLNCAGPFTEESTEFVRQISLAKEKIYIDISGEIGFVKKSFEENQSNARTNKTCIVHACAFESLIADIALQILHTSKGNTKSIHTYYSFDHSKPSPGTRMTMKLSKFRNYQNIQNSNWKTYNSTGEIHTVPHLDENKNSAIPYPLPEIAFAFYKYQPQRAMSYLLLTKNESLFFKESETAEGDTVKELESLRSRKKEGPSQSERMSQICSLFVVTDDLNGNKKSIELKTKDMYGLTAKAVFLVLEKITNQKLFSGVICPGDFFIDKEMDLLKKLDVEIINQN